MLSNNKFFGKCWYGRHPWIRLAMESESMVEKGINFIGGKSMPLKMFLSLNFCFELWHLYKSLLPSSKGLSFTLCNFYF